VCARGSTTQGAAWSLRSRRSIIRPSEVRPVALVPCLRIIRAVDILAVPNRAFHIQFQLTPDAGRNLANEGGRRFGEINPRRCA
jgi:hypothetical protein